LIEHQIGRIVNTIGGGAVPDGFDPSPARADIDHTMSATPQAPHAPKAADEPRENDMSILSTIGRLALEYSEARSRYLTEKSIRSLPSEIQKDIGWPDIQPSRRTTSFHSGSWAGDR